MKFGVVPTQAGTTWEDLLDVWQEFDRDSGFDYLWLMDHFVTGFGVEFGSEGPCMEGWVALAALAQATSRVRLGILVTGNTYRHPAVLAKQATTLDHISGGRLEFGIGAGWHQYEHDAFGINLPPVKERLDRLEEGIQIIRRMFSEERANFEGKYYRVTDAMLYPRPVREHTPLVVGGRGEKRTLRIAARHADGWNVPYINVEEFARLNGVLDMWCEKEGRDPATIERSINLHMHMGANEADATRIAEARGRALSRGGRAPAVGAVSGAPQQAIETIKTYEEAGATRVSIAIRPPVEWDALQAFVEEVMPAVKGSTPALR
jgi:F420-dependent oxidoreductase-like protein